MIGSTMGNRIRILRNRRKISQQSLSDKTSISKGRLGRIERDEISITYNELKLIATFFNLEVGELVTHIL